MNMIEVTEQLMAPQMYKVKPPIGLTPKRIWLSMRFNDIKSAIERFTADNHTISIEWIEEYNELAELIER